VNMTEELWTPPEAKVLPSEGKKDGGTHFDDEMMTQEEHDLHFRLDVQRMIKHLNARPDHTVFVSSAEERDQMRTVFNSLKHGGLIGHWPNIKIDYGVPAGTIRVDEDRST